LNTKLPPLPLLRLPAKKAVEKSNKDLKRKANEAALAVSL